MAGEKLLVLSGVFGKAAASIGCGENTTVLTLKCPKSTQGAFAHIVQNAYGSRDVRLTTARLENGRAVFNTALNEFAAVYISLDGKVLLSGEYRGSRVDDGAVRRKIFYEHGNSSRSNASVGSYPDVSDAGISAASGSRTGVPDVSTSGGNFIPKNSSEPNQIIDSHKAVPNANPEPPECRSAVAGDILRRAEALFEPAVQPSGSERAPLELSSPPIVTYKLLDSRALPQGPHDDRPQGIGESHDAFNPFHSLFPRSVWRRVDYPGTDKHYYEGEAVKDDMKLFIQAIPGSHTNVPPRKSGFRRFVRDNHGRGYWLKIRKIQNTRTP